MRNLVLLVALCPFVTDVLGQALTRTTFEAKIEVQWLDRLCDASSWTAVECSVAKSELACPSGGVAVQMHVPVDHTTGETNYPIGWPRIACALKGWEADWSQWDNFEFMILAKSSREKLPKKAVSLLIGHRPAEFTQALEFAEQGKWITVTVPVEAVKAAGAQVQALFQTRLSVSESDYQDKDVVDFHVGGFRLTRLTVCEVSEFSSVSNLVVFQGQPIVKLDVTVVGPPAEVKRGVPFTLRQKSNVIRRETLPLGRGKQVYPCDISELKLAPGDYELVVFADDDAKRKAIALKVVEDPWKQE